MSWRSSSKPERRYLPIGRVLGRRGTAGELTVKVGGGDAAFWERMPRFRIEQRNGPAVVYEAQQVRAYKDRLILKLRGVDDAGAAVALRGAMVSGAFEDAPELPAGRHYTAALIGMAVVDEAGRALGEVAEVWPTAGTDLLCVVGSAKEELLIPMAGDIVAEINEVERRITVRLPGGLEELNR